MIRLNHGTKVGALFVCKQNVVNFVKLDTKIVWLIFKMKICWPNLEGKEKEECLMINILWHDVANIYIIGSTFEKNMLHIMGSQLTRLTTNYS